MNRDHLVHRRNFAIFCSFVSAFVAAVSLATTFSIFQVSFEGWGKLVGGLLTLAACLAIEGTAAGLVYGLVYALTGGTERMIAAVGLSLTGLVMLLNLVTHNAQARGLALSDWQRTYIDRVGIGVLAGVFFLVVTLSLSLSETRQRRAERELEMLEVETLLDAKRDLLQSDDLHQYLSTRSRDKVYGNIARKLGLEEGEVAGK
ncbi:MAG: hypothetical protein ACKV2V_13650 [Blastocatellia bacterium]